MNFINFIALITIIVLVKITLSARTFNGNQLQRSKGRVARQIYYDYDNQFVGYYGDDEQLYLPPRPIYHRYEQPVYHYEHLHPAHKKLFVMNTFG